MVKVFWLLFWSNLLFLSLIVVSLIGLIYVMFFKAGNLSDEDREEIIKALKVDKGEIKTVDKELTKDNPLNHRHKG